MDLAEFFDDQPKDRGYPAEAIAYAVTEEPGKWHIVKIGVTQGEAQRLTKTRPLSWTDTRYVVFEFAEKRLGDGRWVLLMRAIVRTLRYPEGREIDTRWDKL